jgi:hypothetical protein
MCLAKELHTSHDCLGKFWSGVKMSRRNILQKAPPADSVLYTQKTTLKHGGKYSTQSYVFSFLFSVVRVRTTEMGAVLPGAIIFSFNVDLSPWNLFFDSKPIAYISKLSKNAVTICLTLTSQHWS